MFNSKTLKKQHGKLFLFPVLLLLVCVIFLPACGLINTTSEKIAPHTLKVNEGFVNPLGFYDATPNFSWQIPAGSEANNQAKYHIVVASDPKLLPDHADLWNSQTITSNQSTFVDYQGKPLNSRQQVYWQVRYWLRYKVFVFVLPTMNLITTPYLRLLWKCMMIFVSFLNL